MRKGLWIVAVLLLSAVGSWAEPCEECQRVSLKPLDLSRTPTHQEIIEAGQLGGNLSPTGPESRSTVADRKAFGEAMDAFAAEIGRLRDDGVRRLVFLIGGADGLDPALLAQANGKLAFGRFDPSGSYPVSTHPVIRTHPVTGRKALFVSPTYTVGIEGLTFQESHAILGFLYQHMTQEQFIYRHKWKPGMLLMWDNRCTVHFAEGGYDGHLRVMHRTTVAGDTPV